MIEYLGHLNDPNGDSVIICWPNYSVPPGSGIVYPATTGTTEAQMLAHPEYFSNIYTYFMPTEVLATAFRNIGLTRAVYYPDNTKIYFTSEHFIKVVISNNEVILRFHTSEDRYTIIVNGPSRRGVIGPVLNISNYGDGYNSYNCINVWDVNTNTREYTSGMLSSSTPAGSSVTLSTYITEFFAGVEPVGDVDPYSPGGDTGDDDTDGEGGTGDFDGSTEPIDFPDLPTVSAVDTKFITIFNPSKAQLTSLAEYMWSPLFDIDTLKKLWADPMDCILGLTMVPFSVPNGGTGTVAIGNISTGISMTKAGSQYVAIDCGSINVKEFWGGYLDYDPYTKFQIYLPYVGIKPLLADEIMGKSIHVKYHCDILTGACNCFVKCGGSVLYSFNGQCSTQIPISGNDWRNTISAAINIAGQAAGMYVTGGATAPMGITSIAQSAVNGLKQTVEKSGSLSGTGGMLAIQKPYLIATRPKQAVPKNQNKFTGYPAFITRTLSSCKGYTEVYSCHFENIPCTADELNEIENLLKAGVIL